MADVQVLQVWRTSRGMTEFFGVATAKRCTSFWIFWTTRRSMHAFQVPLNLIPVGFNILDTLHAILLCFAVDVVTFHTQRHDIIVHSMNKTLPPYVVSTMFACIGVIKHSCREFWMCRWSVSRNSLCLSRAKLCVFFLQHWRQTREKQETSRSKVALVMWTACRNQSKQRF